MLNQAIFKKYITEMAVFYGRSFSDFILEAWYERLCILADEELINAIALATTDLQYMPSAKQLLEMARNTPSENAQAYQEIKLSLSSEEMSLSYEQRMENIRRMQKMVRELAEVKAMNNA